MVYRSRLSGMWTVEEVRAQHRADKARVEKSGVAARALTRRELERYHRAAFGASQVIPAMSEMIALLQPYFSPSVLTSCVDRYARVGFGFYILYDGGISNDPGHPVAPATATDDPGLHLLEYAILHEACHVLYMHFSRAEVVSGGSMSPDVVNVTQDMELNSNLMTIHSPVDVEAIVKRRDFCWAERYELPEFKTFEWYLSAFRDRARATVSEGEGQQQGGGDGSGGGDGGSGSGQHDNGGQDGDGSGGEQGSLGDFYTRVLGEGSAPAQSGSGSVGDGQSASGDGQSGVPEDGHACDQSPEQSEQADRAGVQRIGEVDQGHARSTVKHEMEEQVRDKRAGRFGSCDDFYRLTLDRLHPPTVNWRRVLSTTVRHCMRVSVSGKTLSTYRRLNRRSAVPALHGGCLMPGYVDPVPNVLLGIDSSGSMGTADMMSFFSEVSGLIRSVFGGRPNGALSIMSIDTETHGTPVKVGDVRDITFQGGGGTDMGPLFAYANAMSPKVRPDVVVLGTDACFYDDWGSVVEQLRCQEATYQTIVLVTSKQGWVGVPWSAVSSIPGRRVHVVDVSARD